MGDMFDSVDWTVLPDFTAGKAALHITVLASIMGEAFDLEAGNASAAAVATSMAYRLTRGWWSVAYVNESTLNDLEAAMGPKGLAFAMSQRWPEPGIYLWPADPSRNIAKGAWRLPVDPLAVQDRYPGPYDISTTAPNFPAMAAGYIDGIKSRWPPEVWSRYAILNGGGYETHPVPDPGRPPSFPPLGPQPAPAPQPAAPPRPPFQPGKQGEPIVTSFQDGNQYHVFSQRTDGNADHWWYDKGQPQLGWKHEVLSAVAA